MEIIQENQNEVAIFKLNGSLDSNTSPSFEEKVLAAIQDGSNKVIVDFSQVNYIASAGLRVLNLASKKLKNNNGKIVLCSVEDYIREVFEIAGFDLFLPIVADMNEALAKV